MLRVHRTGRFPAAGILLALLIVCLAPGTGTANDSSVTTAFSMWSDAEPSFLTKRTKKCVVTRSPSCRTLGRQIRAWTSQGKRYLGNTVDGSESRVVSRGIREWRTTLQLYAVFATSLLTNLKTPKLPKQQRAADQAHWGVVITFVVDIE